LIISKDSWEVYIYVTLYVTGFIWRSRTC